MKNVIYLHTHDTGRYIQPYGHNVPTPRLQGLAEEGLLFRHAYSGGPTCSPSRSALLSGMTAHSCGMLGLAHRGFAWGDYSPHLSHYLHGCGYETVLCGVQHEAPDRTMLGYGRFLDPDMEDSSRGKVHVDVARAHEVAGYLREPKGRPFFLSFGMNSTHRVFPEVASPTDPDHVMPPHFLPDNAVTRQDMAKYMDSAAIADQGVGIVLDALKAAGRDEDTLVIFTTDHGIAFPHAKCTLMDTGIGVSLIMKFPGSHHRTGVTDALVSQLDLFPTICDFLELPHPSWLQGQSMMPLLEGKAESIREAIFSEVTFHSSYQPMRCIRTDRYKLIRRFGEYDKFVQNHIDASPSKQFLIDHGFDGLDADEFSLHDLYEDPMERINVLQHPRYAAIGKQLTQQLHQWMVETGDPLLNGPVLPPQGARLWPNL